MKITPKRYAQGFCLVVLFLAFLRQLSPSVAYTDLERKVADSLSLVADSLAALEDSVIVIDTQEAAQEPSEPIVATLVVGSDPGFLYHRIYSVASFKDAFPDQNDVQLIAAEKNGIKRVKNRDEAEQRKDELVYVGSNPYFAIDKRMTTSIPYLVPKASVLLQDIGRNFYDSLQIKGIPLHKIIVTSVLRTREDVEKLQRHNINAVERSCHEYGTTFDICYNRYKTVEDPNGPKRREVRNDSLKWVLSEVLNDIRKQDRCYIKYEVKQGCFHITVR